MDLLDVLMLIAAGFFTGFINVVAGGGSLISLPVLIFLGLDPNVANATNRVAIFMQNIFGVAGFSSKGVSAYPYSLHLGIAALFGSVIGASLSLDIDNDLFKKIIAGIMVGVVILTVFSPVKLGDLQEKMEKKHRITGMIAFFFIGIYGGFIQVGVGFIIMAAITHINHFTLAKTNSAKVLIVLVYTSAALVVFIIGGVINWGFGLSLAGGNSLGAWLASRYSVKKGDKWIKRFLLVVAVGMAIRLWFGA